MPQATREIKRRIRSIKNTRQITKAMELVSAAKMRRAVANVLATRTYANLGWELLTELSKKTPIESHPLLQEVAGTNRVAVLVVSSNRGLCAGFNNQLVSRVQSYVKKFIGDSNVKIDLITLGKKGRDIMWRAGYDIVAEFDKPDMTTKIEQVSAVAKLMINDYLAGKYDKIIMAYTDFVSPISQKPKLRQLLPIQTTQDPELGYAKAHHIPAEVVNKQLEKNFDFEYIFEPTPTEVLENLLPRLLEVQVYQAVLESDASEHSARMLAMRNATDAAKDMIDSLTLAFNQARQASITAELADITGGRVAVGG